MDPELAKTVLCVHADHFKNLLDERSLCGLLKDFNPLTAMQIKKNLDRHYFNNNENSNGLIFS